MGGDSCFEGRGFESRHRILLNGEVIWQTSDSSLSKELHALSEEQCLSLGHNNMTIIFCTLLKNSSLHFVRQYQSLRKGSVKSSKR